MQMELHHGLLSSPGVLSPSHPFPSDVLCRCDRISNRRVGGGDRPGALLADIFLGIGLPIAGGIVGYHASGHETAGEVIYRAP